jgi:hypothetical protein
VRVKLFTLVLAGGAILSVAVLVFALFRSSPGPAVAQSGDSASRAVSARRPRSLPRFNSPGPAPAEKPSPPSFVQPAPPAFTTAPPGQAELRERASRDGYLYREQGSHEVFVVQGGTRYYIPSPQEFDALGYRSDQIEEVPRGALGFLRDRPAERTLLRERDSPAVFYIENGQKRFITSPQVFERLGHKYSDIKVVPSGSLGRETAGGAIY